MAFDQAAVIVQEPGLQMSHDALQTRRTYIL